jgi:uncharacterized protein YbjT (DUF2867 family)
MQSLVTVFGGSGFLGRHTVRALARADWRIRVAVRKPSLANFLVPMGKVGQIQLVKADVTDMEAVTWAVRGAEAVVNLVGILQESGGQHFGEIHRDAAGIIAHAAHDTGAATLIHVSTTGVDAESDSQYSVTKAQGEQRVREAFPDATILRSSIVFGPEDNFFNRFAGLARLLPALPLIGGGHTKFQPVFVGDVAKAVERCLADPAMRGKTYELGGPRIYTFREILEIVLRETGRKRWLVPIPFSVAMLQASILQLFPNAMLTRDQVRLLHYDNVVAPGALTFADLGIEPETLEAILPGYLWRFRRNGQFQEPRPFPAVP